MLMKAAFIDCSIAGVSGDMLTAALIDAGAPAEKVKRAMMAAGKPFGGVKVSIKRVNVSGIGAIHVDLITHDEGGRSYFDIVGQLEKLTLPEEVKAASLEALVVLARARPRSTAGGSSSSCYTRSARAAVICRGRKSSGPSPLPPR